MVLIDAFVAEHPADFVHLVQAPHDQPFEVQLGGDAEVELAVEGVVMSHERTGVGSGGYGHQDGRIDFKKPAFVEKSANAGDHPAALDESVGDLGVGDEVEVPLAVAYFHISEAVPFLRKRSHSLGKHRDRMGLDSGLAGAGPHHIAANTEEIANVQVLQQGVVVAKNVLAEHRLHHA